MKKISPSRFALIALFFCILTSSVTAGKYTGLTATSSSGTASAAVDNDMGTRWESAFSDPQWIVIDLGSVKNINVIKIYWEGANAKDYSLSFSEDGIDFSGNLNYTNMASEPRTDIVNGLNIDCRYIKMNGTARNLTYGYSIWEFEVYPNETPVLTSLIVSPQTTFTSSGVSKQFSVSGLDQFGNAITLTNTTDWSVDNANATIDSDGLFSSTTKGNYTVTATNSGISKSTTIEVYPSNTNLTNEVGVSATATSSSGTAIAAFDNNSGTRWESVQTDPQWIKVDLGSIKSITDFVLTWETANAKDYIIEVSDDNLNWTTGVTKTNMASGSRTDRIYDQNLTGRYIRLTGTARTTGYGYSIWEFKIFGNSLIAPTISFATSGTINKNFGDEAFINSATTNSSGSITYSSSNTSVANVHPTTAEISIGNAGNATITATVAANGSYSSGSTSYNLVVTGIDPELSLANAGPITKNYGDAPFTNAATSSNSPGNISYSSNNTSVATVNASTGEVSIVAAGTAIITATIASSLNYNSISVNYNLNVSGTEPQFSFSTSGTIQKKTTDTSFTNTASSSNSAGSISYSSQNTNVATINASTGEVTLVGKGTTVITANLTANGGFTAKSATYTLVVNYTIGSIVGNNVSLYAQGATGGDINTPISNLASLINYKVVTMNGKSWVYVKFTGTSEISTGATWQTQFRYWTVANAKTENNLVEYKNSTSKEVIGSATSAIPSSLRISFFQDLNPGGWSETLLTDYNPTIANTPISEDTSSPSVSTINVTATATTATITITGTDNSNDLYYHVEDTENAINEIVLNGTLNLSGLTSNSMYTLTITPYDFSGNQGQAVTKQFSCGELISIDSNTSASAITLESDKNVSVEADAELVIDSNTTIQDLTVLTGGKVTVDAGRTFTTSSVVLRSDNSGTATFVDNRTNSIVNASVQQYLTAGRNWYITSPVSNADVSSLNTASSVIGYDEPTASWVTQTAGVLTPLKGYISTATAATGAITMNGTLNTGNLSVSLTRTPDIAKSGFNLVGNPYPSYLNWQLVSEANPNIYTTMWFRTKTSSDTYTFATFNASGNIIVSNSSNTAISQYIPPMQAFWVRVKPGNTSANFVVTNEMRSHRNVSDNRLKSPKKNNSNLIRLEISNGVNTDETVIYYNENASTGFDQYDSQKMSNSNASIPEIYTISENEKLVINGLNTAMYSKDIDVLFSNLEAADLQIKATEITNTENLKIILIDKKLDKEHELNNGESYNFRSEINSGENRFRLTFRSPSITTELSSNNTGKFEIYQTENRNLKLKCNNLSTLNKQINIYNATGQIIYHKQTDENEIIISDYFLPGVYLVTLKAGSELLTNKLIINE